MQENGQKIGYIEYEQIGDEIQVLDLFIEPPQRGKGFGKKLLEDILKKGQKAYLEVRKSNQAARNLYEKMGFRPIGIRKTYYQDNQEDAITYEFQR